MPHYLMTMIDYNKINELLQEGFLANKGKGSVLAYPPINIGNLLLGIIGRFILKRPEEKEKIEAIVESVSSNEIHYKKVSMLDGPTFIIECSKVFSIVYGNGQIQTFKMYEDESVNQALENRTSNYIMTVDDNLIYKYGNTKYTHTEYVWYLMKYCPMAYEQYESGDKKVKMAQAFLATGIFVDLLGGAFLSLGVINDNIGFSVSGGLLLATATGFEIACIPTWIIGARKRSQALNVFNAECGQFKNPQVSMNVKVLSNGVGLALNF